MGTKRRWLLTAFSALAVVAVVVGAALFQPWRLFTSSTVDEPLPAATASAPPPSAAPAATATPSAALPAPLPLVLGTGAFQSQEHPTSGSAALLQLPDGTRVLRLENLASSDGPDVKIWLSDLEAGGDWFKYRSGRYLDLGPIKATHGNQNYLIPAEAELAGLGTVVLWCDRFSVAFGSAALA